MKLAIALFTIASLGAFAAPAPKPQTDANTPAKTTTTKKVKKQKAAKAPKAKKAKKNAKANTEATPSK